MSHNSGAERLTDDIRRRYPYPLAGTYNRAYYLALDQNERHDYLLELFEASTSDPPRAATSR